MMVLCVLASGRDGRTAMMDAGAVAALVEILKKEVEEEEEERCVAVIYGMSRGSGWRFRGLARAAGAEEVVVRVAEKGCSGEEVREMAKKAVRAMRGEVEDGDGASSMEGSVASDGALSFSRTFRDFAGGDLDGINSAEF
ncbi:hypothetical protein J5N97_005100 [Dioscorea zingiberensis]|uniref:Uncharacterized protein n=1 Tax=Dioscorea zingiberensis TaxID=325984 RepID=A0A9D5D8H0_9LILI|nr:hypothetical protein J5N97_005100 [Dioscorea zingiberensis]